MRSIHGGSDGDPWSTFQSAAESLSNEDVVAWSDEQVRSGLRALLTEVNRLDALVSTVIASFDARGLAERDAFRSTRSWLIAFGRLSQAAATGWLTRGRLQRKLPALAAAARDGDVSGEHIRKVAELADHVGVGAVQPFDEVLTGLATVTGPVELEKACNRIRAHVDPDGAEPDPDASARRSLSISRSGSLFSVAGRLDAEGGATVLTALDALMRPPATDDTRTAAQRRADAMGGLAPQAPSAGRPPSGRGVRAQPGLLPHPPNLAPPTRPLRP